MSLFQQAGLGIGKRSRYWKICTYPMGRGRKYCKPVGGEDGEKEKRKKEKI
jgi:hypothetical protein